jgi:methionyl-tRNA synthetase
VPAAAELTAEESAIAADVARAVAAVDGAMREFAFQRALGGLWEFVGRLNGYVDGTRPWELAKDPARRPALERVLYVLGESLRVLGILLAPFVPEAAAKIRAALGVTGEPRLTEARWGGLAAGAPVQRLSGLFPRVMMPASVEGEGTAANPRDADSRKAGATPDATGRLSIAEFGRLDLRVAEVVAAETLPKSKKLLKLTVSLGDERRTVVAGIAEHYAPADLVGKKVVVVANLEPAKLMGVESQGMVLAGSTADRLAVLTPDRDLPPGARVR